MILVLLADGFEEIEALTPVDMLRREGFNVKTVGINGKIITGAHKIPIICDVEPKEVELDEVSLVVFPGGMPGALNLDASPFTDKIISAVAKNGGRIAAICAAPLILGRRGLLDGKRATCYPGFEGELRGATVVDEDVVTDGNITTARGMSVALPFAEELVSILTGKGSMTSEAEEEKEVERISLEDLLAEFEDYDETVSDEFELFESDEAEDDGEAEVFETKSLEDIIKSVSITPACCENYEFPPEKLLKKNAKDETVEEAADKYAEKIIDAFLQFDVKINIKGIKRGPRLTSYEIVPAKGVRPSRIQELFNDIALSLGCDSMRMIMPSVEKTAITLELPRKNPTNVCLGDLIFEDTFKNSESKTVFCLGKDVGGDTVYADIAKMPHVIVAGATGMGKSVCINSIIASILYKATPDEVRFILIDPKNVEFVGYRNIPHLLHPVITDAKEAAGALMWAVEEMERRYELLERAEVRKLDSYNEKVRENPELGNPIPKIIIAIDELSDIMSMAKRPAEDLIMSIAQKARAAGIHLIIGTQRPSIDVLTGVIKANIPSRISCKVSSCKDSKNVLEMSGAEKLLNNGDMLYISAGAPLPIRVQGAFISDGEIASIQSFFASKQTSAPEYDSRVIEEIKAATEKCKSIKDSCADFDEEDEDDREILKDEKFVKGVEIALKSGKISTSLLQRHLMIGYSKAAMFIDYMENLGIVSESLGQRPRELLITDEEWKKMLSED